MRGNIKAQIEKAIAEGRAIEFKRTKLPPLVARPVKAACLVDSVTVPLPPSQNNMYINLKRGGRVPAPEYRAWQKLALPIVKTLRPPSSYPCKFFCMLGGKINLRSDGDNRQKALLDSCKKAGVIPDDNLKIVRGGAWHYEASGDEPYAVIWFEPWN